MNIELKLGDFSQAKSGNLPLGLFFAQGEGLKDQGFLSREARQFLLKEIQEENFQGKSGETLRVLFEKNAQRQRFLISGLGPRKELDREKIASTCAHLYQAAKMKYPQIQVIAPGQDSETLQAVAEGLLLASYRFEKYKKPEETPKLSQMQILVKDPGLKKRLEGVLLKAQIYAEAVCFVRDLVNEGPSDKTPETLAQKAKELQGPGLKTEVLTEKEIQSLGMGSFLGVARGSAVPPRFIHMIYKGPKAKKKVGLVGKGITFDSGGLSLKPSESMETMKMDMAGAATVFAVVRAASRLRLPVEVHGFAPLTYNLPGPDALKPGDIVRAMNGKTIEVLNTDAEGRLVLADALSYAGQKNMDVILDIATLTGAAVIALGSSVTAVMGNDPRTMRRLQTASKKTGERIWELPLVEEYKEGIKSKVANLQNISSVRREAGTIIGGLFLQEFVDSKPWVHLDVAGTAWTDKGRPDCPPGGTGAMVRTLLEYLSSL